MAIATQCAHAECDCETVDEFCSDFCGRTAERSTNTRRPTPAAVAGTPIVDTQPSISEAWILWALRISNPTFAL